MRKIFLHPLLRIVNGLRLPKTVIPAVRTLAHDHRIGKDEVELLARRRGYLPEPVAVVHLNANRHPARSGLRLLRKLEELRVVFRIPFASMIVHRA